MKRVRMIVPAVSIWVFSLAPASAVIGAPDVAPAASLLLPTFVVDVSDGACATGSGVTTLFALGNASASAALAHVTVWTDVSVPVLDFDVYLTGFDIQTINLRDVFCNGLLPATNRIVSNQGPISQSINFPGCNNTSTPGEGPNYAEPAFTFTDHLRAWLTGDPSPVTGNCAGARRGDDIAIGYLTIDSVVQCNQFFPADIGYFSSGIVDFRNILFGDYFLVDNVNNFAQGFPLVHLEASFPQSGLFVPGDHTFYGRYVAFTAIDGREPLPSQWAARYVTQGAFSGGTTLAVWREGLIGAAPFSCALIAPPGYPLVTPADSIIFDEEENIILVTEPVSGAPTPDDPLFIPWEANLIEAGSSSFATPFAFGWVLLNLRHPGLAFVYGDDLTQSWVTLTANAEGRFSVGWEAVPMDNLYFAPLGNHTIQ
jgi:hypothetical protein